MRRRPGRGGLGTSMADVNAVDMDLTTASSPSGRVELPRGRDRRECLVNLGFGVGAQICRQGSYSRWRVPTRYRQDAAQTQLARGHAGPVLLLVELRRRQHRSAVHERPAGGHGPG